MKKDLVIVGGGFAGLYTYRSLSKEVKEQYTITLIDEHNYFLFTPLLHEVATGALDAHHVVESLEKVLGPEVRFVQNRVVAMNHDEQKIILANEQEISYDIAVMALGSTTNFFSTPGAKDKSFVLKNLADAQKLKDHFISIFNRASQTEDEQERRKLLSVAIIGGGPTGVELAGETAELFFDTFKKYYRGRFNTKEASISLINGAETLLRPFSESSQFYAQKVLKEKGVQVLNNTRVVEVHDDHILTADGEQIDVNTVVWAAGVIPQVVDSKEVIDHDRHRIKVNAALQMRAYPEVFVLGDMALVETHDGRGYPMLAQVAKQQGVQTAENIKRIVQGEGLKAFSYRERGSLASLGQWHAIAEIGNLKFYGPLAWFMWRTIYLVNFNSWSKRAKILLDWTVNLFSSRDITKL